MAKYEYKGKSSFLQNTFLKFQNQRCSFSFRQQWARESTTDCIIGFKKIYQLWFR